MSESYSPDPGVEPQAPYDTVFLSQRDLSLRVPINFVTNPGVSFTAACFPFLQYEDDESGDCLSNLLAVGFRRFEIDLYWDAGRGVWSFCPVSIPTVIANAASSVSTIFTSVSSVASSTPSSTNTLSSTGFLSARQDSTVIAGSSATPAVSTTPTAAASTLGSTLPTFSVIPDSSNKPLVAIGPYVCTTTINLSTFTSQILDYIETTQNNLEAHIIYVILNIHAAASYLAPDSPAPVPISLPGSSNYLGNLFSGNFSSYLYTPSNLASDRRNLNDSWYQVTSQYRPVEDYYNTQNGAHGIASTEDGWPSESYIELAKSKRLLLGWGAVDPQMARYNFTGDASTIFPTGYLQAAQTNVNATSTGELTSGCFLHNVTNGIATDNSSWAFDSTSSGFNYPTSSSSDIIPLLNLTTNTTNCGISPILNITLLNSTAHTNYRPYQNFTYSTIWSWAPGEPKTYTTSSSSEDTSNSFRCATTSLSLSGRFLVSDCNLRYPAACCANSQPYNWTITTSQVSYEDAEKACPKEYSFAAPRTALENLYLTQEMRRRGGTNVERGVWIDFNNLDILGCWTQGGSNATCPYSETLAQLDDIKRRTILVPTIAAVIVLVVSILTVFVKVAGNRQVRKRARRRANNGLVYEGVPS